MYLPSPPFLLPPFLLLETEKHISLSGSTFLRKVSPAWLMEEAAKPQSLLGCFSNPSFPLLSYHRIPRIFLLSACSENKTHMGSAREMTAQEIWENEKERGKKQGSKKKKEWRNKMCVEIQQKVRYVMFCYVVLACFPFLSIYLDKHVAIFCAV